MNRHWTRITLVSVATIGMAACSDTPAAPAIEAAAPSTSVP